MASEPSPRVSLIQTIVYFSYKNKAKFESQRKSRFPNMSFPEASLFYLLLFAHIRSASHWSQMSSSHSLQFLGSTFRHSPSEPPVHSFAAGVRFTFNPE